MQYQAKVILIMIMLISFVNSYALAQDERGLTFHSISTPMVIDGDEQLAKYSVVPASGKLTDPYILEADITGQGILLTVKNTRSYFVIRNSNFSGGDWAIVFDNVRNGRIENVMISNSVAGVKFQDTTYSSIDGLTAYDFVSSDLDQWGIALYSSSYNTITGAVINMTGLLSNSLNLLQYTGPGGMKSDPSNFNTFYENTVIGADVGLFGDDSEGLIVSYNEFRSNRVGVLITNMKVVEILDNTFFDNAQAAISLRNSSSVKIAGNIYKGSGDVLEIDNPGLSTVLTTGTLISEIVNVDTVARPANFPIFGLMASILALVVLNIRGVSRRK